MNPQLKTDKRNINKKSINYDNQIKNTKNNNRNNNYLNIYKDLNKKFENFNLIKKNNVSQIGNNKFEKKKIRRKIFIDYSKNPHLLSDNINIKEENKNLNLNIKIEFSPLKENKNLGIKKKRTNDDSLIFQNNIIKILKEDEETFPGSSELILTQSNLQVNFFLYFFQVLKKIINKLKILNISFNTEVGKKNKKYFFEINNIKYFILINKLRNNKIIELIINDCNIYNNDKEILLKLEEIYNKLKS